MPITNIGLPTSFVPTSITGCQVWFDGKDPAATGTAPSNGAAITTWKDKSGNGYDATSPSATKATYGSNGGLLFVGGTYNGTNSYGSGTYYSSSYTAAPTNETVFIVYNLTDATNQFFFTGLQSGGRSVSLYNASPQVFAIGVVGVSWGAVYSSLQMAARTTYIGVAITSGGTNTYAGVNGTTTLTGPTVIGGYTAGTTTVIGAALGNNLFTNGYIYEIIAYNSVLSADQRQQVERYLAWKWNVPSVLPTSHLGYRPPPIPLSLVPFPTAIPHTFKSDYIYYTVPGNATASGFYMWGGGGAGGGGGQPGGGGAFLAGTLAAAPGETFRIIVGRGGQYGTATQWSTMTDAEGGGGGGGGLAGQGGQGGGRSAIQKFIGGTWTEVVTAGGGGSAGGNAGTYGGNAYYTGTSQSAGSTYGQGRTPTGGSASAGGLNTFTANVGAPWDGTQFTGGLASNAYNVSPITGPCGGGGGGGGYYGGGGGGRSGADTYGGGGGSSYYNATYVTGFSGSNGSGNTAVATTIPGRSNGAGMGGAGGSTNNGSNGQVIFTHSYAKTLFTLISNFMSTFYNLSGNYSLVNIANGISGNSATPAYVWTVSVPPNAKGKNGILALFFNLYASAFTVGQSFDYGVYVDGVSQLLSDTGTLHYVQSVASTYALSSNGVSMGTNGPVQLLIPMAFATSASQIQIGLKNSSAGMTPINSALPGYNSNIVTSSGSVNTSNYVPQTLFTTGGSNYYTVPTNTSAGVPTGVYIYLWGCGGITSHQSGGGGGFVSGYYSCPPGTNLLYVVGSTAGTATYYGGGGSAPNQPGGGFSGVFLSNAGGLVQSNAIAIAGGGGGGCLFPDGTRAAGGGGYPTGGALEINTTGTFSYSSSITGGTQTAGGIGATGVNNGGALSGGAVTDGQGRAGGGGGGWYGGGGNSSGGSGQPGAGGSGYIGNVNGATGGIGLTANAAYENGIDLPISQFAAGNAVIYIRYPGGSNSPYYASPFGQANSSNPTGAVVIVPAIGTSATQIGVKASLFSG